MTEFIEFIRITMSRRVDPQNGRVRHAADMLLERLAMGNLRILGEDRRVTPRGEVQTSSDGKSWQTRSRVYPHQIDRTH